MASCVAGLCLGCGKITEKTDRRNLLNTPSQHVLSLWKHMLKLQLDKGTDQVDLERMISDAHLLQKELRYMCRSCFYAYNKVVKAQEVSYILRNCVVYMYRVRKSKLIRRYCDILRTPKHWQFFLCFWCLVVHK